MRVRNLRNAVAAGLFGLASFTCLANADENAERVKIIVGAGDDAEIVRIDDLPVGAGETVWTDSGKEVIVYRGADHIEVDVGGESTVIDLPDIDSQADHGPTVIHKQIRIEKTAGADSSETKRVIVKRFDGDVVGADDELAELGIDIEELLALAEDADHDSVLEVDVDRDGDEERVVIIKRSK